MKDDGVVFPDAVPVVGRFALPNGTAPLAQGVPAESDSVTLLAVKLINGAAQSIAVNQKGEIMNVAA